MVHRTVFSYSHKLTRLIETMYIDCPFKVIMLSVVMVPFREPGGGKFVSKETAVWFYLALSMYSFQRPSRLIRLADF